MIWRLGFVLLALTALGAAAHDAGKPDFVNRFGLYDTPLLGSPGNYDLAGNGLGIKQQIFTTVPQAGDGIFVTIGQSRISNQSTSGTTQYTPTNGINCLNLNPYDGNLYKLVDPVLGASWLPATPQYMMGWHGQLCDKLINASKYTRVIFIPIAQSGSSVADWLSGTGFANIRLTVAANWLTYLGWTPTAWLWQQGSTDCINGMSQATYAANLRSVISYERGLSGRSGDKWMIGIDTVKDASGDTCAGIETAQTSVGGDSNNFIGPNVDSLPTSDYGSDIHFNNTGNSDVAGLWSTKIQVNF